MGFKCVVIALALVVCLSNMTFGLGPKDNIVQPFPTEDMSGSEIYQEVQGGVYTDVNDSTLSFRNESLFLINKYTGMSPNAVGKGVRTPVKIYWNGLSYAPVGGNWSFTLTSVDTSYLRLDLYQNGDAVSGSGVLTYHGFNTPVSAAGTVLGDRLALFVTPAGTQNLYRFSLTITPGSMNGDYVFTAPGVTQPGVAFGSLLSSQAPSVPAQPTAPAPAYQAAEAMQTTQAMQTSQAQEAAPVY
jgi:hypothetical protein